MKHVKLATALVVLVLLAAACGSSSKKSDNSSGANGGGDKKITVGAANFAGARAVSEAYARALKAKGYDVSFKDNIGTREQLYTLLKNGQIDMYGEFTGSLLTYLKGTPTADRATTFSALQQKLQGTGFVATNPAEAQDVNGFYVTKDTADKYGLATMSDLKKPDVDGKLVFGGPPECQERDLCLGAKEQQVYGLKFKSVKKLDAGGPITSKALKDGTIQVGELFTGSSVIDPDFVLLKDDKGLQPADNPTALIRQEKATSDLLATVNAVNAAMTLEAYNKMSTSIDVDKVDPAEAAKTFLEDAGIAAG
jgi:osmoprotectant transport system substrate-binding protein